MDKKNRKEEKDMVARVKPNMEELRNRATKRKNDTNLRHTPTKEELAVYNQNAKDMRVAQYRTIKE